MTGLEWLAAGLLAGCLSFLAGFKVGRQVPRSRPAPPARDVDDEIQPPDPRLALIPTPEEIELHGHTIPGLASPVMHTHLTNLADHPVPFADAHPGQEVPTR